MLQENRDRQLNKIRKIIHEKNENFNKRDRAHKKIKIKILELKNKIKEMKTAIAKRRLHKAGKRISELENTASKLSKRRKIKNNLKSIWKTWNIKNKSHLCLMKVPEEKG